ncbi:MAG: GAF domain-containing protein [Betaproteobacteria bacterium]|nr:MAG: GAF domain-containing protein [Betaproteobacteria bacterium]
MPLSWRQIVHEVNVAPSLHDALALIVHGVKEALPVDACAVYLTDIENDQFVLMASDGLDATSVGQLRVGPEGLVGLVVERRELVVLTNAAAHPRYRLSPDTAEERYGSFIGMPLIHHQRVLGVLAAWKRIHRQFDNDPCGGAGKSGPPSGGSGRSPQNAEWGDRRGCIHPRNTGGEWRGNRHRRTARSACRAGVDTRSRGAGRCCGRDNLQERGSRRSKGTKRNHRALSSGPQQGCACIVRCLHNVAGR